MILWMVLKSNSHHEMNPLLKPEPLLVFTYRGIEHDRVSEQETMVETMVEAIARLFFTWGNRTIHQRRSYLRASRVSREHAIRLAKA